MDEDRLFQKFSLKQCIVVCEVLPKEQIETLLAGIDAEANSTENDITDSNLASPTSSSSDTVPFHTLSNSEPFSDTESTDVQSDSATVEGLLPEGSPCAEPNSSAAEPEAAELETCLLTPTQTCTPFSIALVPLTKPCFVMVEKLSQNFIRKALKGRVHWKDYFNDPALAAARKRTFEEVTSEPEFEDEEESDDAPSYDEEEEEDYDEPKKKRLRKKSVSAPRRVVLHQCERCTFSGTSKKQLMLHSTCHKDNVDPLRCELCPAIAYSIADMKRHIYEFHEGPEKLPKEVIYGCKGCTPVQKFSDLQTCNYHVVNHVTPCEKGYKCAVCNNTYLKYQTFTEHMSAHILLKCTFCEKMYPKLEAIESHCQTSHFHYGRPFGCELCPFRSAVFGLLLQHRDERHGIMRDKGFDRCKFCIDTIFPFSDYESMLFHLGKKFPYQLLI